MGLSRALDALFRTINSEDSMLAAPVAVRPFAAAAAAAPSTSTVKPPHPPPGSLLEHIPSAAQEHSREFATVCARVRAVRDSRAKALRSIGARAPVLIGKGAFAQVHAFRCAPLGSLTRLCVKSMFVAPAAKVAASMFASPPKRRLPVPSDSSPETGPSSATSSASSTSSCRKRQREADEAAAREMDVHCSRSSVDEKDAAIELQIESSVAAFDIEVHALGALEMITTTHGRDPVAPRMAPSPLTDAFAIMIGMERAESSLSGLHEWLQTESRGCRAVLSWLDTEHLIWSLFDCLSVAHDAGLVHADLCTRNILVFRERDPGAGDTLRLRIGDWGSSLTANHRTGLHTSHAATVNYYATRHIRPPEQILPHGCPFGAPVDIWAAATATVEILQGRDRSTMVFPVEFSSYTTPGRFAADDIIRTIHTHIGPPPEGSSWRTLVDDYLANRSTGLDVCARHRKSLVERSRPAAAFRDAPYTLPLDPDAPGVAKIAASLDIDRVSRIRAHVASACKLRVPDAPDDPVARTGVVPACTRLLLACLLRWDPLERPTASQIIKDQRFWSRPIEQIRAHRVRSFGVTSPPFVLPIPRTAPGDT